MNAHSPFVALCASRGRKGPNAGGTTSFQCCVSTKTLVGPFFRNELANAGGSTWSCEFKSRFPGGDVSENSRHRLSPVWNACGECRRYYMTLWVPGSSPGHAFTGAIAQLRRATECISTDRRRRPSYLEDRMSWRMPAGVHGMRSQALAGSNPVTDPGNGFQ